MFVRWRRTLLAQREHLARFALMLSFEVMVGWTWEVVEPRDVTVQVVVWGEKVQMTMRQIGYLDRYNRRLPPTFVAASHLFNG